MFGVEEGTSSIVKVRNFSDIGSSVKNGQVSSDRNMKSGDWVVNKFGGTSVVSLSLSLSLVVSSSNIYLNIQVQRDSIVPQHCCFSSFMRLFLLSLYVYSFVASLFVRILFRYYHATLLPLLLEKQCPYS